jgi:hypothetical protein
MNKEMAGSLIFAGIVLVLLGIFLFYGTYADDRTLLGIGIAAIGVAIVGMCCIVYGLGAYPFTQKPQENRQGE